MNARPAKCIEDIMVFLAEVQEKIPVLKVGVFQNSISILRVKSHVIRNLKRMKAHM